MARSKPQTRPVKVNPGTTPKPTAQIIEAMDHDVAVAPKTLRPPMKTREPTLGSIVHYYENSAGPAWAAMITSVSDEGVTLVVFRTSYTNHVTRPIPYAGDLTADGPAWRWPPGVPGAPHLGIAHTFPGATGPTVFGEIA